MIRAIAAVDDELGVATDNGIPWSVPADVEHFRDLTMSGDVLMGYGTYLEFAQPMPRRTNYVATGRTAPLREGFLPVADLTAFLSGRTVGDLWIVGGAMLYAATLDSVQEIELTRVAGNYGCTKFFPRFDRAFRLTAEEVPRVVGGIPAVRFQTWQKV